MYNYTMADETACTFYEVGDLTDLPAGERLFIEIDDLYVVIFNLAGQFYAIADVCTHDDGPLGDGEIEGEEVVCPRHGAHFDLRTGKALSLPAVEDIPAYPVRVENGKIFVGVPEAQP